MRINAVLAALLAAMVVGPVAAAKRRDDPPAQTATVTTVTAPESVAVRHRGAWNRLAPGGKLAEGDEIHTGPTSIVGVRFSDGSTITVMPYSQVVVANLGTRSGRVQLALKIGEVTGRIKPKRASLPDFNIGTGTALASLRGTDFAVFVDTGYGATLVSIRHGAAEVDPAFAGFATVDVPAGKEVEVTRSKVSPVAAVGRAGALPGGVNRERARALVLASLRKTVAGCELSPESFAFKIDTAANTWRVSIRVSGAISGWGVWTVVGTKVATSNPLAKRIAAGCR